MATPHSGKGGIEVYDVVPDVTYAPEVVSRSVAWHASRTALRLCRDSETLPFVERVDEDIYEVGTYSPADYADSNSTLFGHQSQLGRASSFIIACKALERFAGTEDDMGWVYIVHNQGHQRRRFHQDFFDGARSFVQLAGLRVLGFSHNTLPIATTLTLEPGEAYGIQFHHEESSVEHSADYYGFPENLALCLEH